MANDLKELVSDIQKREVLFSYDRNFRQTSNDMKKNRDEFQLRTEALEKTKEMFGAGAKGIWAKPEEAITKMQKGLFRKDKNGNEKLNESKFAERVKEALKDPKQFGKTLPTAEKAVLALSSQKVAEDMEYHANERADLGNKLGKMGKDIAEKSKFARSKSLEFGLSAEFQEYIKTPSAERINSRLMQGYEKSQEGLKEALKSTDKETVASVGKEMNVSIKDKTKPHNAYSFHKELAQRQQSKTKSKSKTK